MNENKKVERVHQSVILLLKKKVNDMKPLVEDYSEIAFYH